MNRTATGAAPAAAGPRAGFRERWRRSRQQLRPFLPPYRSWHFWMIQGLVILIASFHGYIETTGLFQRWHVPFEMPTGLFLVPVVYAALTFGLSGSIITALWATLLSIVNIVLYHGMDRVGDALQVVIVIVVAFFVGREVDRVKGARQEAEATAAELKASRMRYRSLFESSPVAILLLDARGVILEANPAATVLFNTEKPALEGLAINALFGTEDTRRILAAPPREGSPAEPITVKGAGGLEIHLEPMTNELGDGQGNRITEVLLRDVTREYGRQSGQRAYTAHITRAQEEERQRIARDIHDQTIQSLMLLCRRLDSIQEVGEAVPPAVQAAAREARTSADEIIKGLRDLIKALRPPILDDLGLVTSIRRLTDDFAARTGVAAKFRFNGEERRLPSNVELGLFRIAQEALWNVELHAEASRVVLAMTFTRRDARLEVIDNGKGFAMPENPEDMMTTGHLGLISMQERAKLLGGTLTIRTGPGDGTLVIVSIPLAPGAPES